MRHVSHEVNMVSKKQKKAMLKIMQNESVAVYQVKFIVGFYGVFELAFVIQKMQEAWRKISVQNRTFAFKRNSIAFVRRLLIEWDAERNLFSPVFFFLLLAPKPLPYHALFLLLQRAWMSAWISESKVTKSDAVGKIELVKIEKPFYEKCLTRFFEPRLFFNLIPNEYELNEIKKIVFLKKNIYFYGAFRNTQEQEMSYS